MAGLVIQPAIGHQAVLGDQATEPMVAVCRQVHLCRMVLVCRQGYARLAFASMGLGVQHGMDLAQGLCQQNQRKKAGPGPDTQPRPALSDMRQTCRRTP